MAADEIQQLHAEIEALRADLEGVRNARRSWLDRVPRPRSVRRLSAIALGLLLIALPVAVSASHQFTDVPNSNSFHGAIGNLYGARLTTGCSPTRFCPSANVTRGQMAAFLNRGLGRGEYDFNFAEDWDVVSGSEGAIVTEATLRGGGGTGGTGYVFASGLFNAYTSEAGVCPCELQLQLINTATGETSFIVGGAIGADAVPSDAVGGPFWQDVVNVSGMFTVPSGTVADYQLFAKIVPTSAPDDANAVTGWVADMQLAYLPFDGNGGNPEVSDSLGGGRVQPRGE